MHNAVLIVLTRSLLQIVTTCIQSHPTVPAPTNQPLSAMYPRIFQSIPSGLPQTLLQNLDLPQCLAIHPDDLDKVIGLQGYPKPILQSHSPKPSPKQV
jgi:hypothetical protein